MAWLTEENDVLSPIREVFQDFDKLIEKLDKIPKTAETKTNELLKLFFDEKKDIFKDPQLFLEKLNNLSEEVGHAQHIVLAIELARQRITPQQVQNVAVGASPKETPGQPITINTSAPQQLGWLSGMWYAKGEVAKAKAIEASRRTLEVPQITTSKEVVDILDSGRQLPSEFNRVQNWFQQAIDHLHIYNDQETHERLLSELRKHINKLAGIIRAFCRTVAEYRKDALSEGKKDIAESIVAMKMAEYQSLGGMQMKDIYKAMREAAGSQDAGRD